MKRMSRLLLALVCGIGCAQAQPFAIDWYTIDGGGGTSSGGPFVLSGTIGQPDASATALVGGNYTLQGGFWPGVVIVPGGEAPTLFLQLSGASVVISWSPGTPGFTLEQTDDLRVPFWSAAPAGNPTPLIPVTGSARFYRLKKP